MSNDFRRQPAGMKIAWSEDKAASACHRVRVYHPQTRTVVMHDVVHAAMLDASTLLSAPHVLHCPPDRGHPRAAFRDDVIAVAVDEAVDLGSLYFSSAGNDGTGYRFMSVGASAPTIICGKYLHAEG